MKAVKDFFKFLWHTLFNNMNIINGKRRKFYQGFIVVVLSLFIAIIPVLTFTCQVNGSDILRKRDNASLDVSLTMFTDYLADENNNAKFYTSEDGQFVVEGFKELDFSSSEGKHLLTVRVVGQGEDITKISQEYTEGITNGKPTTTPKSFMLIEKDQIHIAIFTKGAKNELKDDGTIKKAATASSTYIGFAKAFKGHDFSTFNDVVDGKEPNCVDAWAHSLNKMYEQYKVSNVLYSISLYTALNIVILLTMALITMVLTRVKSAQCEKMTYVQSLNCMNWASLSPSIIAMILGFLIPSFASVAFIICIGVRSVSLGFKASNGQQAKY